MKTYVSTYHIIHSSEIIEYQFEAENISEAKILANEYKHQENIHGRMKVRRKTK
jgi:hypothetical protein